MALATAQPVTSGVVDRVEEWDALRPEWDALYAAARDASPALTFAWLRRWWRIYGPIYGTNGLQIVTVRRGERLIAALPLYTSALGRGRLELRQVQFLSTGEAEFEETCPDYLDMLCVAGEEETCAAAIVDRLERMTWDQLLMLDVPEGSALLTHLARSPRARTFTRGACPVADLSAGFDHYLGRLSANNRQQIRRLLRESERAGARFEIVAADQADSAFDDLVRLHQLRWTMTGQPGVFAASRFTEFHRETVREWVSEGRAILARLSLEGEPLAVLYGFVRGRRFEFYQSGVHRDKGGRLQSPGNLAHIRLMQALADLGIADYDFLRGTSAYKERLATHQNRLAGLRISRATLRAATYRSARLASRMTGRRIGLLFPEQAAR